MKTSATMIIIYVLHNDLESLKILEQSCIKRFQRLLTYCCSILLTTY